MSAATSELIGRHNVITERQPGNQEFVRWPYLEAVEELGLKNLLANGVSAGEKLQDIENESALDFIFGFSNAIRLRLEGIRNGPEAEWKMLETMTAPDFAPSRRDKEHQIGQDLDRLPRMLLPKTYLRKHLLSPRLDLKDLTVLGVLLDDQPETEAVRSRIKRNINNHHLAGRIANSRPDLFTSVQSQFEANQQTPYQKEQGGFIQRNPVIAVAVLGLSAILAVQTPRAIQIGVREGIVKAAPRLENKIADRIIETVGIKNEQVDVKTIIESRIDRVIEQEFGNSQSGEMKELISATVAHALDTSIQRGVDNIFTTQVKIEGDPKIEATIHKALYDSIGKVFSKIDINAILTSLDNPETLRELLAPLAAELPKIVGNQLDVNKFIDGLLDDPASLRDFILAFAPALAQEVGKDVDFNPLIQNLWSGILDQITKGGAPIESFLNNLIDRKIVVQSPNQS